MPSIDEIIKEDPLQLFYHAMRHFGMEYPIEEIRFPTKYNSDEEKEEYVSEYPEC